MNKKKILLGCSVPLLIVGIGAFAMMRALKPKPKPERSETVQRGDVEIKVVENGTIEPLRKVEVKSKAGGRLLKLFVDEGKVVKVGDVLATIDPQEVNTQVAALQAQLIGAQARYAAASKSTDYQKDQTTNSIAQYEQAVIAAKARLNSALSLAKVQPELTAKAIEIAQANLEAAKSNLRLQQDNLRLLNESTHPQSVVNAQTAYDRALAQQQNQQRNLERQRQLLAKGFVAQQLADNAATDVRVAETQVREAKQRLDRIHQTNALEAGNAQSQILSARSQVHQMEAQLAQARADVSPATRQQEADNARAALAQAQAQLASAKSGRTQDRMRGDEAVSADAQVKQIKSQLDELLVRQNDTTIFASMAGVITRRYVEEGEMITSALSGFSSGTPIFQIGDLAVMLVKINVNEVDIAKIKEGTLTEVSLDASNGTLFTGKVRKIAPSSMSAGGAGDSGSRNNLASTNTGQVVRFLVEIQVDKADPRLHPGMSARCAIVVSRRKNVLRLPINCVQGSGDSATVQIITTEGTGSSAKETLTSRKVKLGLKGDDFVEILDGVKEGEKVRPNDFNGPARKAIDVKMD